MSLKVLVIPEDFTKDEHILKPLVERLLEDVGKPRATVLVCRDPNFGGLGQALNGDRLRCEVFARYPMVDVFLPIVDRDGNSGRDGAVSTLEETLNRELAPTGQRFFAELAWQEVEIFILAGLDLPGDWPWKQIRADSDVKNTWFQELVRLRNTSKLPHDGRKKLMSEAVSNWVRIKSRCPEDVGRLLQRLGGHLSERL